MQGERLGDANPAVQRQAVQVLLSLLQKVPPEQVLLKLESLWGHPSAAVRCGLLQVSGGLSHSLYCSPLYSRFHSLSVLYLLFNSFSIVFSILFSMLFSSLAGYDRGCTDCFSRRYVHQHMTLRVSHFFFANFTVRATVV